MILLAAFVGVIVVLGAAVGAVIGGAAAVAIGAVALVVAVGLAASAYLYSDRVALSKSRARPASPEQFSRYHNLVEGLCVSAGLPKPALYVIDDAAPNSFATGRNPDHAAVVVTTGLLDKLSRIELEGVLAHELAHIANRDTALTSIAATLVGPLSGKLISMAAPRQKEGMADLAGVKLTRYPPGLISALEKLRADSAVVSVASRATAHLWIESPTDRSELEGRIAALRDL